MVELVISCTGRIDNSYKCLFIRYQKQYVEQSRRGWIKGMRALLGLIRNYKK